MGSAPSKPTEKPVESLSEKQIETATNSLASLDISTAPLSSDGSLTLKQFEQWESKVSADPKLRLTRTILTHTDLKEALLKPAVKVSDPHVFNLSLPFKTDPITSQNASGRCWLFATTNVLRYAVMQRLGLKDFQLSQSYLFFYDKLEKANYYLELSIQNADLPLDDRVVSHVARNPVNDGGQWDMACNLMENYGVVPRDVFPETFSSSNSRALNSLLTTRLREHALILRKLASSLRQANVPERAMLATLRSKKEKLMGEVWTMMSTTLGAPLKADEVFVWDYIDKYDKARSWKGTPKDFFKNCTTTRGSYVPTDSFSLIHDPRNDYGKLYTVEALGNVWGGRPVLYVNTEVDRLKQAVITLLKAGQPVFFGSDVGQSSDRAGGVMDTNLYEFENAFDIKLSMTKTERLQTGESAMTHAMVISGVHLDEQGKPVRYKVENSWGPDVGNKGYFVMTDKWFEEFVYQVVVPTGLADKDLLEVFNKGEKVTLPPWDPMGALA